MNWLVCAGFAALLFAALLAGGAPLQEALLLALFAGVFTFRWFARCFAYVDGRMAPPSSRTWSTACCWWDRWARWPWAIA